MEKLINGVSLTREMVVEVHRGLVHKECQKLKAQAELLGHEYEDMVSVGFIGLINAFDRFDNSKYDVRFSTFAVPQIWGAIQSFFSGSNQGVYYPKNIKDVGRKIRQKDMEEFPVPVIAKEINESVSNVEHGLNFLKNGRPTHLEKELENGELSDSIGIPDDESVLFVSDFLKSLTDLEKKVISKLMRGELASEVARGQGCSPSNIVHIRRRVAGKYAESMKL